MTTTWALAVDRDDLSTTTLLDEPVARLEDGEVRLRISRVGMTANNVTYAGLGSAFGYWDFFPTRPGLGLVPLWGFADVSESRVPGVEVGTRVYGYLPPAGELVVLPDRLDERGFRDSRPHRAALPSAYNDYVLTAADPVYQLHHEDLLALFRPLFFTSFMLADQLEDNGFFGAGVIALSSASSKTAYGTAFVLRGRGPEVVGLTSAANVAFTESLGCYDRVVAYDHVADLDAGTPTGYLDVSGRSEVRQRLRAHLGDHLVHDAIVGATAQDPAGAEALSSPGTTMFFAPDQIRKRSGDWGRDGLNQRFAEAWQRFAPVAQGWIDIHEQQGPEALRDVWLEVLAGSTSPRTGHIVTFPDEG